MGEFETQNGEMVQKIRVKYNHSDKIIERIKKRSQQTRILFHFVLARLYICSALQS